MTQVLTNQALRRPGRDRAAFPGCRLPVCTALAGAFLPGLGAAGLGAAGPGVAGPGAAGPGAAGLGAATPGGPWPLLLAGVALAGTAVAWWRARNRAAALAAQFQASQAQVHRIQDADQALRASEQFFRELLALQGEGFAVVDGAERILFANPVAEAIFQVPVGSLQGRSLNDFLEPDQKLLVQRQTALRLGGKASSYALRIRTGEGEHRTIQVTVTPRLAAGSEAPSFIGVFRDITELQRASEALRASEEKFSKAFQFSPDSINITRIEDGVYLAVNQGFLRTTGYSEAEVLGRSPLPGSLGIWACAEDRERLVAGLRRDGMVQGLEARFRRKDGTEITGLMSASLIEVEGQPCLLSITRDISERIRAEEDKARLQVELSQAQKLESLGSLAGGVAHDMNNVLGAILATATAQLPLQPAEGRGAKALETIIKAAERGGTVVRSLLGFARQSPAEQRVVDLNLIIREEVQLLERTTLARVQLKVDLAPELRPMRGDPSALAHAIMNLCVNAVEAMAEGGSLTLATRNRSAAEIELEVCDTGCGMPPEVLEKALDPFFTTKPMGMGTGLGLSMVYRTVRAHDGQLTIQTEPGRGTCIALRFPVIPGGAPAAEALAPEHWEHSGRALEVLLVDDDELIQEALVEILVFLGHRVTPVWSGEEALASLEAGFQPDVVILDMNMPGLGGAGTMPRLRALRPQVPVLLATGRTDQAALDVVTGHRQVTLLAKPFRLDELKRMLATVAPGPQKE